jgi:hypothetical protein
MDNRNKTNGTWTALNQYLEINTATGQCRLKDTKDIVPNLRYTIEHGVKNYAVKSFKEKRSTDNTTNTTDTFTDTLADTEEWRWVIGVEGVNEKGNYKFKVSNLGRYANVETGEILRQHDTAAPIKNGKMYKGVSLDGVELRAHIGVALAFCYRKDPLTQTQVHHRDGNPSNNHADNLEWLSPAEHIRLHVNKAILLLDYSTEEVIKEFNSLTDATNYLLSIGKGRTFTSVVSGISKCLTGKGKSAYGFKWRYKD